MEVKKEITINASKSRVFSAITDPQQLTQWFPDVISIEPKIGGKISFKAFESNADNYENKDHIVEGIIIELEANKKLTYTWSPSDIPDFPPTKVVWLLEEIQKEKTKVTITHSGILDEISKKPYDERWDWFAQGLKTFTDPKKQQSKNKKGIFVKVSGLFVDNSKNKIKSPKKKVNVALQMILTCVPFMDIWTFYRIRKLRLYLLILIPLIIGFELMVPYAVFGFEYNYDTNMTPCITQNGSEYCYVDRSYWYAEGCDPILLVSVYYNPCQPEEIRNASSVFSILILVFALYLVRYWSKKWNEGELQDVTV